MKTNKFALTSATPALSMPDLSDYLTTREAASVLGFTIRGVQNLIKKSKLNAVSVGRFYLISKKSLQEYMTKTQGLGKNDPTRGKTE